MKSWMRRITLGLAGLGPLFVASVAAAQTITVNTLQRDERDNPYMLDLKEINRADCIANDVLEFNLTLSGSTSAYTVEVWEGTACEMDENRNTAAGTCNQIFEDDSGTRVILIPVQTLLAKSLEIADAGTGAGGAGSATGAGGAPAEDATVCDLDDTGSGTLTLYFFLIEGGRTVVAAAPETITIKYDLVGPAPPTNVKVAVGEEALSVEFDESEANADDLSGYDIYCAEGCDSSELVAGDPPPAGLEPCGEVVKVSEEGQTDSNLTNGQPYTVAISARDTFGNPGDLSNTNCATPEPVTGFYEAYRAGGGKGGGAGICTLSGPARSGLGALGAGALFLGAAALRRLRSRRS
jgi:hypothetical protein